MKNACVLNTFLSLSIASSVMTASAEVINLHYNERLPYLQEQGDQVVGLTGTPANDAFNKAGIDFRWINTAAPRQLTIIKDNQDLDCAVGWFKNPDREKFAKYTQPIYQDKSQVLIARSDNDRIQNNVSLAELFADKSLNMGIKIGYSYGSFVDEKIAALEPRTDATSGENITMLKKVYLKRNDYFILAPEEAGELIKNSEYPESDFKFVTVADMPEGQHRYILCSQQVGDDVIEKLNQQL